MDRGGEGQAAAVIVVIGHYPAYIEQALAIGASCFQVDLQIWNGWTVAEQWSANQAFLDDAVAADAVFVLATSPRRAKAGSWYGQELDYLQAKGYRQRFNEGRLELIR